MSQLLVTDWRPLASGRPTQFELRCRCGDGSYRWLNWSANPLPEESRIYAVAHDVTDRKAGEDALRAESAFRKAMEDSVLTGLQAIAPDGRILYINRAFSELVDFPPEALINQLPPFPYWPEKEYEQNWQRLQLCLDGQAPADGIELRIRRSSGKHRDVRAACFTTGQCPWRANRLDDGDDRHYRATQGSR